MSSASQNRELREGTLLELRSRMRSLKRPEPVQDVAGFLALGVPALDRALGGGVAKGKITEFVGKGSSGRTALAVSLAARVSAGLSCDSEREQSRLVAWLDTGNSLDVAGLQAAGVCMSQVLWLRGTGSKVNQKALKAVDVLLDSKSFSLMVVDFVDLALHKVPQQSSWWMRITRKLQSTDSALLVISREPCVFQPACRVAFSLGRSLDEALSFNVMHRGCGEVHSFSPVQLRRPCE